MRTVRSSQSQDVQAAQYTVHFTQHQTHFGGRKRKGRLVTWITFTEKENNQIAEYRTKVCLTKTNIMFIYLPALYAEAQEATKPYQF